jgi:hypothetical protein
MINPQGLRTIETASIALCYELSVPGCQATGDVGVGVENAGDL